MARYRLYVGCSLKGLPENLTVQHEAEYPDDGTAHFELMDRAMQSFKDAYAISVAIKRLEAGKEVELVLEEE